MIGHMTLFFEPLDVLQFRDHRPFDAGFDVVAESVFPMPSVFYGCIRTALLVERCPDFATEGGDSFRVPEPWRALLGGPEKIGTLTLRGPLLARWEKSAIAPLFPVPCDLVFIKGDEGHEPTHEWKASVLDPRMLNMARGPRRLRFPPNGGTERKTSALPWTPLDIDKSTPSIWLTRAGAEAYLGASGELFLREHEHAIRRDNIVEHEDRVGIARDPETDAVEERMLYVKRPLRLAREYGFAVDLEVPGNDVRAALEQLDGRVVPLGGKGHRARVRIVPGPLLPADLVPANAAGGKRWLLSPLPMKADAKGVERMVTERAAMVGGYDLAARAPKPLRRALPSGTVLHLAPGETLNGLFEDDDRRMGYGTALGWAILGSQA